MARQRPSRRLLRSLCAQVSPDDGVDPRFETGKRSRRPARKARQLCSQVAEALSYVLADQGRDDVLGALQVLNVEPAPHLGRLLVTVGTLPSEFVEPAEILAHLDKATARLRCEVASAITRRRAPALVFRIAVTSPASEKAGP